MASEGQFFFFAVFMFVQRSIIHGLSGFLAIQSIISRSLEARSTVQPNPNSNFYWIIPGDGILPGLVPAGSGLLRKSTADTGLIAVVSTHVCDDSWKSESKHPNHLL
jgi:hypothetical protein